MKFGKWVILVLVAIIGAPFIGCVSDNIREEFMSEKMIYQNKPLPPFRGRAVRAFMPTDLSPVVRLETKDGKFFCSGTVISDDYVLTAAHCLMADGFFHRKMNTDILNIVSMPDQAGIRHTVKAKAAALNQRADYALIKGDFSAFYAAPITTSIAEVMTAQGPVITCGYPWGAKFACFQAFTAKFWMSQLMAEGYLFPGMSGGPVVDYATGTILAINTGTLENGAIVLSPLVGLFETLGVVVENE